MKIQYLANSLKKRFNRYRLTRYECKPWMNDLLRVQQIISNHSPHPQYLSTYRNEEIFYWLCVAKWMHELAAKRRVMRCLDIGCAYGTLSLYAKEVFACESYCTDFTDSYMSKDLLNTVALDFKVSNIEHDMIPWECKFDVILFTEVLEHLNYQPVPTLSKIRKSLSNDGILFMSTPDASKWGKIDKYYLKYSDMPTPVSGNEVIDDHIYQYTKRELLQIVKEAGFSVLRFSYAPGILKRHFNLALQKNEGHYGK